MKRNATQTKENKVAASNGTKTMKTTKVLTVLAALCFASTAAHAGSMGYNTKTGAGATTHRTVLVQQDLGHFTWVDPNATVNRIVVSIADQSLYAYNGQELVAYSNISSGKLGHETPTGTFTISQKDVDHHSSIYDNAPMPFYMRLTDGGVGLHAGFIPGYPASHGCVRLPMGMARELYQHTESGTPVTITTDTMAVASATTAGVHFAQN